MAVTQVIRLTHPRFYSVEYGRFTSPAFKNQGVGASVVCPDCGTAKSGSLCAHIARFYSGLGGEPPVFKRLPVGALGAGARLEHSESNTGDKHCHYDIVGLKDKALKLLLGPANDLTGYEICDNGEPRALELADLARWHPTITQPAANTQPTPD